MKKPKKLLKDLARLASYLKKESARLEKILSRSMDKDGSPLMVEIISRLSARRDVAMSDLGLVSAAQEAASTGVKVVRAKKTTKKAAKKTGKKAPAKKAPVKKTAAKKPVARRPARPRKPKAAASAV